MVTTLIEAYKYSVIPTVNLLTSRLSGCSIFLNRRKKGKGFMNVTEFMVNDKEPSL